MGFVDFVSIMLIIHGYPYTSHMSMFNECFIYLCDCS